MKFGIEWDPDRSYSIEEQAKNLKDNGFEVGAWIWTFWVNNNTEFRNMRSIKGSEIWKFMWS